MGRPIPKRVADLANQLALARAPRDGGSDPVTSRGAPGRQGRAVVLIGAGCSRSAGIPVAADVARYCAIFLKQSYESGRPPRVKELPSHEAGSALDDAARAALRWLHENRKLAEFSVDLERPDWGRLYLYFFDAHLASPNRQREFLAEIMSLADGRLNWAHIGLGELVRQGYVGTVLTTNFDHLAFKAVTLTGALPVIADGLEAITRILPEPTEPQIIYLHGSMHTYCPRNSQVAISETHDHAVLPALLYSLLHRCDLLLVVGYAGHEEGIMRLLQETAEQLRSLVIFWVHYEHNETTLSLQAAGLLATGENKFLLTGLGADELFRDLMNNLGLGVPEWMADPLVQLRELARSFPKPFDGDIDVAVTTFRGHVADAEAALAKKPSDYERAALARLKGDYQGALDLLANNPAGQARYRRALTFYDLAQLSDDCDAQVGLLNQAKAGLDALKATPGDQGRGEIYLLLVRVLLLLTDLEGSEHSREIVQAADAALKLPKATYNRSDRASIELSRGNALLDLEEKSPNKFAKKLLKAAADFRSALESFEADPNSPQWAEAKAGLALTLEKLAKRDDQKASHAQFAAEALEQHRGLVAISTLRALPLDQAARLVNAAEAVAGFADLMPDRRVEAQREARSYVDRALEIYKAAPDAAADDLGRAMLLRSTLTGED